MQSHLLYIGFAVFLFIAVAMAVEALWQWWFSTQSKAARRFSRRINALSDAHTDGGKRLSLLKQRRLADSDAVENLLRKLSFSQPLDVHLQQAGSAWKVGRLLSFMGLGVFAGLLLGLILFPGWLMGIVFAAAGGCMPLLQVSRQRANRLRRLQSQLPEAADLIARSLRAGHALPSTLQMVADEMPEPISGEFRLVADEINYGLGLQPAMQRMAERVPLDDLRFLVIAVLIQRESGGNLAELMQNMANLIRERLKLFGQIRSLSAEGRLSGWILFLLPVVMGLAIFALNPDYMGKLFSDPAGQALVVVAAVQMLLGGLWMRKIVNLRV